MSYERTPAQKLTMQQRIDAFYRQSGGPNNPDIKKFLDKHLMYGKDHGVPGSKETMENAFLDMVINDDSMLLLFQRLQRFRQAKAGDAEATRNGGDVVRLREEVTQLRNEIRELRQLLERALHH